MTVRLTVSVEAASKYRKRSLDDKQIREIRDLLRDPVFGESPDFMNAFDDAVMAAYENHKNMSEQVVGKGHVKKAMAAMLLDLVYDAFQERR